MKFSELHIDVLVQIVEKNGFIYPKENLFHVKGFVDENDPFILLNAKYSSASSKKTFFPGKKNVAEYNLFQKIMKSGNNSCGLSRFQQKESSFAQRISLVNKKSFYENDEHSVLEKAIIRLSDIFKGSINIRLREIEKICSHALQTAFEDAITRVHKNIFLIFGLCCSRPAYIFGAITGASSTRIPSNSLALN